MPYTQPQTKPARCSRPYKSKEVTPALDWKHDPVRPVGLQQVLRFRLRLGRPSKGGEVSFFWVSHRLIRLGGFGRSSLCIMGAFIERYTESGSGCFMASAHLLVPPMYHRKSGATLTTKVKNLSMETNKLLNADYQQKSLPRCGSPLLQAMVPEHRSSDPPSPVTGACTSLPAFRLTVQMDAGVGKANQLGSGSRDAEESPPTPHGSFYSDGHQEWGSRRR
jgi:hypothetical protein